MVLNADLTAYQSHLIKLRKQWNSNIFCSIYIWLMLFNHKIMTMMAPVAPLGLFVNIFLCNQKSTITDKMIQVTSYTICSKYTCNSVSFFWKFTCWKTYISWQVLHPTNMKELWNTIFSVVASYLSLHENIVLLQYISVGEIGQLAR